MPRVIGIDPGTVSVDVCGLDEGRLFLDRSLPTSEALAEPSALVALLDEAHRTAPLDLVAGPSGYGLPLTAARDLTDTDLRLAYLAAEGESGGIGGLRGHGRPPGVRAAGGAGGEVAVLAGQVPKPPLFRGGAATIAGGPDGLAEAIAAPAPLRGPLAWDAYVESSVKAAAALAVSVPRAFEVILSGRMARVAGVREELTRRLAGVIAGRPVHVLTGFAVAAKQGAQGAALIADGLAGGASAALVDALGIREACGTVLDHLYVITPAAARARLGIA